MLILGLKGLSLVPSVPQLAHANLLPRPFVLILPGKVRGDFLVTSLKTYLNLLHGSGEATIAFINILSGLTK